jgi:hypothetical protein
MKIMFLSGNSEENDSMSTPFPSMEYQSEKILEQCLHSRDIFPETKTKMLLQD